MQYSSTDEIWGLLEGPEVPRERFAAQVAVVIGGASIMIGVVKLILVSIYLYGGRRLVNYLVH